MFCVNETLPSIREVTACQEAAQQDEGRGLHAVGSRFGGLEGQVGLRAPIPVSGTITTLMPATLVPATLGKLISWSLDDVR